MEENPGGALARSGVRRIQLLSLPGDLVFGFLLGYRWLALGLPSAPIPWWGLGAAVSGILASLNIPMGWILGSALRSGFPEGIEVGSYGVHLTWPRGPRPTAGPEAFSFEQIRGIAAPNLLRPWSVIVLRAPAQRDPKRPNQSILVTPTNALQVQAVWEAWKRSRPLPETGALVS